jgi:uncharacterized delta-60 repeat protein
MMKTLKLLAIAWLSLLGSLGVMAQSSVLDTSFNPGTGANGIIETVLEQPDGKILICGNFTVFNGVTNSYIARLNPDGSVDTNFNSQVSYWVRTMALQPDGKIVIGGFFPYVAGVSRNLIARLNSDGSLDTTFDPGTGASGVLGIAVDGDADPFIFAAALQADGKILITGNFTNYNGVSANGIARLTTNGMLDPAFNTGAGLNYASWGRSITVLSNSEILLTGWFVLYNNRTYNRMVMLNSDGTPDTTFNPNFGDLTAVYGAVALTNGQFVVVGDCQDTNNYYIRDTAKLNSDGSFDYTYQAVSTDKTESVRQQPNGQILMGGYFGIVDGQRYSGVARLNLDGSIDPTLSVSVDNFVWDICLQTDGKILISGGFFTIDGVSRNSIARLLPGPEPTLTPVMNGNAFSVSFPTLLNVNYTLQYVTNACQTNWISITSTNGTGSNMSLSDSQAGGASRIYRVMAN